MNAWLTFWTAALLIAGFSFAMITGIVTIKGYKDLRDMFSSLTQQKEQDD